MGEQRDVVICEFVEGDISRASLAVHVPAGKSDTLVPSGNRLVGNLMPGTLAAKRTTALARNAITNAPTGSDAKRPMAVHKLTFQKSFCQSEAACRQM